MNAGEPEYCYGTPHVPFPLKVYRTLGSLSITALICMFFQGMVTDEQWRATTAWSAYACRYLVSFLGNFLAATALVLIGVVLSLYSILAWPIAVIAAGTLYWLVQYVLVPAIARSALQRTTSMLNDRVYGGALLYMFRSTNCMTIIDEIAIDLDRLRIHRRGLGSV